MHMHRRRQSAPTVRISLNAGLARLGARLVKMHPKVTLEYKRERKHVVHLPPRKRMYTYVCMGTYACVWGEHMSSTCSHANVCIRMYTYVCMCVG